MSSSSCLRAALLTAPVLGGRLFEELSEELPEAGGAGSFREGGGAAATVRRVLQEVLDAAAGGQMDSITSLGSSDRALKSLGQLDRAVES